MKIDPNKIENFDSMSDAEKVNALLGLDIDDKASELSRVKTAFDKTASQLAALKKENDARKTQEERDKEERENAEREREEKYKELERKCSISDNASRFQGLGFDTDGAKRAAEAYVDGNSDALFKMLGDYKAQVVKSATETMIKSTPRPEQGGSAPETKKVYTREDIKNMSREEIIKHYAEIQESLRIK